MPLTNFPNGITSFGVPLPSGVTSPGGMVFFVDDSSLYDADDPAHGTADMPFRTVAYAYSQTVSGRGDTILVGYGHSESLATIQSAIAAATPQKTGVTISVASAGTSFTTGAGGVSSGAGGVLVAAGAAKGLTPFGNITVFTINGVVRILDIVGQVITPLQAVANNALLQVVPTGKAAIALCAASNLTGAVAGTLLTLTNTVTDPLVLTAGGALYSTLLNILTESGIVRLVTTANQTGTIVWSVRYQPVGPGAIVQAV